MVLDRCELLGLSRVAALARGIYLPCLRAHRELETRRWQVHVCRVRLPDISDGGHDLRPHPTSLTAWFTACWLFATAKDGVSALSLQRSLEVGSYQTAWAMLHRLRSVLVTPSRDRRTVS